MDLTFKQGGWLIMLDELYGLDRIGLRWWIERALTQGRSLKLTVMMGLQRPVGVTRWSISQARNVVSFAQEGRDIKTIAEATTPRIIPILERLGRFEFAWYYRPTRQLWKGKLKGDKLVGTMIERTA